LPSNFQTVKADSAWSTENAFVGKWYGFYPNGREVVLAVERVKGEEVTAIYALGPGLEADQKAEWVRRSGRVAAEELLFREKGRNTLKYRLRPDGRLAATWISVDGVSQLEATLRRID
jgi:hypothetical protein